MMVYKRFGSEALRWFLINSCRIWFGCGSKVEEGVSYTYLLPSPVIVIQKKLRKDFFTMFRDLAVNGSTK